MSSTQPDMEPLIPGYLAGRLTSEESEAFERALSERPQLRQETELALKLKEGLARLRDRGELDALLRAPARPGWLPYAAAAAIALVCLTALAWLYLGGSASAVLGLSPQQFASGQRQPPSVVAIYVLARTRGSAATTEVAGTGVVEVRALPSMLSPQAHYRVQISAGDGGAGRVIGQVDAGLAAADGYVTFYLDAGKLPPGDYELSLSPLANKNPGAQTDRFPIRLR